MKFFNLINPYNCQYLMVEVDDLDFDGGGAPVVDNPNKEEDDPTPIDGSKDVDEINKGSKESPVEKNENDNNSSSTGELSVGDNIEYDGVTYSVAENGDIVDKDGNVFKEAKDVKEWLDSLDKVEDDNKNNYELNINSIQEAIGITVTDDEGKPVEFTNDANGIKSYVNSVLELKSNELQEAAVNKLYADNPLVKQFIDYCQVTGSPRGFGDIPDRSGIQLDRENEAQLEYVIRMAASEFGNKSLNDNYIKYLKTSGGLYDEAKNQLEALVAKDKEYKENIEKRAEQARIAEEKAVTDYWNKVNNVINSKNIAGYKLPDSFIKEVNGTKVTLTPNDFYKYLSRQIEVDTDGNRMTAYQRDLNNLSDDDLLNRELLDAWLLFTGGSYKDLVDMAIKEDKVKTLRLKSKEQRTAKTVKIIKSAAQKASIEDIML